MALVNGRSQVLRGIRQWIHHHHTVSSRSYTPRRACLYVPGNDIKKITKIPTLDLDCTILDCEDGVALNRKEEARHTIAEVLDSVDFGSIEPIVRVNSVDSGLAEDDLMVTLGAKRLPPTLMLPKVENRGQLDWFAEKLSSALRGGQQEQPFNLIIFMESAIGLLNLHDICNHGNQLTTQGAPFRLEGIVFGSDDFVADIGATRTLDAKEILYARQKVLLTAKAHRLQAIDMVHINFRDNDALRIQAEEGALMGYTGKQCIHPVQVPVVQQAFTPAPHKVEWATQLIQAFEEHQGSGQGAFTFRGHMIDMPLLLQAKNIVHMVTAVKKDNETQDR